MNNRVARTRHRVGRHDLHRLEQQGTLVRCNRVSCLPWLRHLRQQHAVVVQALPSERPTAQPTVSHDATAPKQWRRATQHDDGLFFPVHALSQHRRSRRGGIAASRETMPCGLVRAPARVLRQRPCSASESHGEPGRVLRGGSGLVDWFLLLSVTTVVRGLARARSR